MQNKYLLFICIVLCAFKVHDGDSISKISYRLAYIDAPELKQTCKINGREAAIGQYAKRYLEKLIGDDLSQCKIINKDFYGRAVADCGINFSMIESGWAVCYDNYMSKIKKQECHALENKAKIAKKGIWACDSFMQPKEFRKRNK